MKSRCLPRDFVCVQCGSAFARCVAPSVAPGVKFCGRSCQNKARLRASERDGAKVSAGPTGDSCVVIMRDGTEVIIDRERLDWFLDYPGGWRKGLIGARIYVRPSRDSRRLHQHLMPVEKPNVVDHANGNTLDNRLCNLRPANRRQHTINRGRQRNQKSQYIGVHWSGSTRKWTSKIKLETGERLIVGYFVDEKDAARARDAMARKVHGEFARLNFSETSRNA